MNQDRLQGRRMRKADMSRFALFFILSVAGPFSVAQGVAPDVLLRSVTSEVIIAIKQDRQMQEGNSARVASLIEARILPHFDFHRATQIAVGRAWRQASEDQRGRLAAEFRALLVRWFR